MRVFQKLQLAIFEKHVNENTIKNFWWGVSKISWEGGGGGLWYKPISLLCCRGSICLFPSWNSQIIYNAYIYTPWRFMNLNETPQYIFQQNLGLLGWFDQYWWKWKHETLIELTYQLMLHCLIFKLQETIIHQKITPIEKY